MIMLDNGFSSPRRDAFPAGLRVLVVDDDPTWLKILEKMLKKCSYEVTTCGLAREALSLLRERKNGYDIVISDVNMPDMDGFKLLEHVGLEMDLPVIMMSVDGETSRVMKGVQHGACDYLLKPIRMKELRNIWQHVLRKRLNEVRDIESIDSIERADHFDDGHSFNGDELTTLRKRKDHGSKYDDKDMSDSSTMKKARVVWTVHLHQKFVDAVNQIGFDKVGPKKILELMNVPWLTRENVASHLQKYRLYLDRLQKENGQKNSSAGIKNSNSKDDPSGNFGHHQVDIHQSDITSRTIRYPNDKVNVHNIDPRRQEDDLVGSVSIATKDPSRDLIGSVCDPRALMANVSGPCKEIGMQGDFDNTFASVESQVNYSSYDSSMPTQYAWSDIEDIQFEQDSKPLIQPENGFNQLPLSGLKHQIQVDVPQVALSVCTSPTTEKELPGALKNQPSYGLQKLHQDDLARVSISGNSAPSARQREVPNALKDQPLYAEKESSHVSSKENANNSFLMQCKNNISSYTSFDPISSAMLDMENQAFSLNSFPVLATEENSIVCGSDIPVALQEGHELFWLLNDYSAMGFGLENLGVPWNYDPGAMADIPINYSDGLRSDYENPAESFMTVGQGLST